MRSEHKTDSGIKANESHTSADLSNIRKTLYCIRHAQSEYNETIRNPKTWLNPTFWWNLFDPKIRDPLLSEKGKIQVNDTSNTLDKCSFFSLFGIELIVTSPLQRAMHTMFGIVQKQMNVIHSNNINMIAHNELREWIDTLGDIGTTKSELIQKYPTNIDFSVIDDECWWNHNANSLTNDVNDVIIKESKQDVRNRISAFKHWILQREENNILVIGHSRWFREFVGATFKLNNCQMMKVELHGIKIHSWEYIDFDQIQQRKSKVDNIIQQSRI